MIRELRAERGQEKMRAHNEGEQHAHRHRHGGGPSISRVEGSGGDDENNLDMAKAHRDRLLSFQTQNARRTRIVDEAADFETPNIGSTLWMSPAQRALALKKQHRIQREMDEKARPEWERKNTVMSLDIKGGKVRKVYHSDASPALSSERDAEQEKEKEEEEEEEIRAAELSKLDSGHVAFSRNPLLASGGLLRPIWKAPQEKQKLQGKESKQAWRRVQDDRDDNEQWILDGGLHGYSSDSHDE